MSTIIFLKPLHFGRFSSFCCCHLFLWQEMTRHGESVYNRVLNKTFAVMLETMNSCLLRYYTWWEVGLFPQNSLQTDFLQLEHDALPEQDVASSAFFSYPFGGAVNPLWEEYYRLTDGEILVQSCCCFGCSSWSSYERCFASTTGSGFLLTRHTTAFPHSCRNSKTLRVVM